MKKQPKITVYTTISCGYCMIARDYFLDKGLKYKQIDVSNDEKMRNKLVKLTKGKLTVPVIVIGKEVLCGFNKSDLDKLLDK